MGKPGPPMGVHFMSGLSLCLGRVAAGLVGVVVAVALIAAPAAWANGDTITAAAGVQFSGVVDSGATCAPGTAPTIAWGDGSSSQGTYDPNTDSVSGTHTYASGGTLGGTVTLVGGTCDPSPTTDTFTANVGATPQFTECPQVGVDVGCQFLIDVTASGTNVLQDSTQGPYESSEDALIGVKNDSSSPLSSIPISTPGSGTFSFDGDGLCDNGAGPVPSGCLDIVTGAPCDPTNGDSCAFAADPGQPGADPDAYSNSTQNGYEGPTSFFTNVSPDQSSGTVNFSPAIPPGGSTYFSLEEPPSANAINVGATPIGGGLNGAPTVTATTASFVAIVDPNGSLTSAQFQFSLDPRYGGLADAPQTTPLQTVGGDFANHVVSATVGGLVPNALYHVHLVASNKNGQTVGPDVTFHTTSAPPPGAPSLGRTFNLSPVSGLVLIKVNGAFIPLTQVRQFPKNTVIDALGGTLNVITAVPGGHAAHDAAKGKKHKGKGKTATQSGTFGGAIFKITQAGNGLATMTLVENAFKGAPSYSECATKKAGDASAAALSSKTLQLLHASAKGKFATKGKYAAATVQGTKWGISDRCDGTLVRDITDSVAVTDFVHHKTIILHAGQRYLAKKP
jgi:hypothetical protein